MEKKCLQCNKLFKKGKFVSKKNWENRVKFCSTKCKFEAQKKWKKGKSHHWKGDKASYSAVHYWLFHNFGKADRCENRDSKIFDFECSNKCDKYHWALKKGYQHVHNRNNYYMLCISCHWKYDLTKEKIKRLSKQMLGNNNASNIRD